MGGWPMGWPPVTVSAEMTMSKALTITKPNAGELHSLAVAGQVANHHAARSAFADYRSRKAKNTIARQDNDLAVFAKFLQAAGVPPGELNTDPDAWRGVTFGIVEAFAKWMLAEGYSIGTINLRLSTVKTYARLAFKAGAIDATEHALIRTVQSYTRKEGKRLDEARATTRRGTKKAEAVSLTPDDAQKLKAQPDTPQGRRDAVLMGLLLTLGLRVGEVAGLKVGDVDLKKGTLTFYRPKVDKSQTHELKNGLWAALKDYFKQDAPKAKESPLLRASIKSGKLGKAGLNRFALMKRVRELGKAVGIEGLSPHDCRHYWATCAARSGTPIDRLQDAGGWASPAMPLRYVEAASIANEGVKLEVELSPRLL
jgi:integrase